MRAFLEKLWKRLEHIVIDFCVTFAIIGGLGLISLMLHHMPLPENRIALIESIHFWVSVILILLFSFFTLISLGKEMFEEVKDGKSEDDIHV